MASCSALSRALARACIRRAAVTQSMLEAQQRSSSTSAYTIYTPKARSKGAPVQHKSRSQRQEQQRFAPRQREEQGIILLDRPTPLKVDSALLQGFVDALSRQELESVWTAFDRLHKSGELASRQISRQDHGRLLRLCIAHRADILKGDLGKHWIERFGQLAESAALTGEVRVIFGWFRLLIGLHQPGKVIQIWHTLVASTSAAQAQTTTYSNPEPNDEMGGTNVVESSERRRQIMTFGVGPKGQQVEVYDVACLVVIACYTSNRPNDVVSSLEKLELGTYLRPYFSLSNAKRICRDICLDVGDAAFIEWPKVQPLFWQAELARGLSSGSGGSGRLARLISSLFESHQTDSAFQLFEAAMVVSTGPHAWLAVQGTASPANIPAKRAQWTEGCWTVCLSEFIALGATDQAMKVWSHYHAKKLTPTPRVWNALLDGYARAKKYDAAITAWQQIQKASESESKPFTDTAMYTTMISVLFRLRQPDDAMALFDEMKRESALRGGDGSLHVSAETYNTVIFGLLFCRQHEQAEHLLEQMRSKGPYPTISTINTFLRAHARVGDLSALAAKLRQVGELKLTPDVVTLTTVLDGLLRKGGGGDAQSSVVKVLSIIDTFGVAPNVVTYTAMIKAALNDADPSNMDIVTQSISDRPSRPSDNKDQGTVSVEAALALMDRMLEARIIPTEVTYTALIGGCVQQADAVAYAFQHDRVPRRFTGLPQPIPRLQESPETVEEWRQRQPHVSLSLLLFDQLKARRLPITNVLCHYLIEGLCSRRSGKTAFLRGLDLMDEMLLVRPTSPVRSAGAPREAGPMVSSLLAPHLAPTSSSSSAAWDVRRLSHTSWVVIFTSLLERIEGGNGGADAEELRPLSTAVRLAWSMDLPDGATGGQTLTRLLNRATSITKQRR